MNHHNDTHNYSELEAIDLARGQLDFAALAATTPSIKAVLYKAQTMGPLTVKPSPPKLTAAAGLAVGVLGALCLPWVPQHESLAVVQAGFEQPISRVEAQRLVSRLTRDGVENVVVSSEFVPEDRDQGRLRLSFVGVGVSPERLQREYSRRIADASGARLQPLFSVESDIRQSGTASPLQLAADSLAGDRERPEVSEPLPQAQQAADAVLGAQALLKQALARRYDATRRGVVLEDLAFLKFGQTAGDAGMDFVIEAWPLPLGVNVLDFSSFTSGDQQLIMQVAQEFAVSCGLADALPTPVVPFAALSVNVLRKDGSPDRYMTGLLQSYLVQPSAEDLASANYDPKQAVEQACARLMPGQPVIISFSDPGRQGRAHLEHYAAAVRLCGLGEIEHERRIGGLGSGSLSDSDSGDESDRDW